MLVAKDISNSSSLQILNSYDERSWKRNENDNIMAEEKKDKATGFEQGEKKMKRWAILLCTMVLVMLWLSACTSQRSNDKAGERVSETKTEGEAAVDQESENLILKVFVEEKEYWRNQLESLEGSLEHRFTITDMDQDGEPELIFIQVMGSGRIFYRSVYGVDSSTRKLMLFQDDIGEAGAPDMLGESTRVYLDGEGVYRYIFHKWVAGGSMGGEGSCYSVGIEENKIENRLLGWYGNSFDEKTKEMKKLFKDAEGNAITEEKYNAAEEDAYGHLPQYKAEFLWMDTAQLLEADDEKMLQLFAKAYEGFSLTAWQE